jgi:hypothetical protein
VIDRAYRTYARIYRNDEPAVFEHMVTTLATKYRLSARHGSFWIFERATAGTNGTLTGDDGN